ncbi:FBP domain-containing protein [Rhodococcus fascians]|nr:FBP domain-containing protein [Rhodococcus fascians]MBY3824188.1 FBP domain-containing protein [Rhodococcus fascians]MBY3834710.1 FBP domain-containing protein [Rhodococcus fascians]MBY3863922.1 FBP domain-containing protein [Rhodococcus fascians]MBY3883393.1 FBP domain-containing protein [Rhodococcus fascians]
MKPISERDIRSSFVNSSKGDATRLSLPDMFDAVPWEDLDFLGWADPKLAGRSYIIVPQEDRLRGIALRYKPGGPRTAQMCSICLTTHANGGVSLMAAAKAGESGRRGNTVGTYICSDLACSLYARKKKTPALGRQFKEDFDVDTRTATVRENIDAFVARIVG